MSRCKSKIVTKLTQYLKCEEFLRNILLNIVTTTLFLISEQLRNIKYIVSTFAVSSQLEEEFQRREHTGCKYFYVDVCAGIHRIFPFAFVQMESRSILVGSFSVQIHCVYR